MGKCCKCVEYTWSDPQDVVWTDPADRKLYCVFHAPKEEKRKGRRLGVHLTVEQFNALVFKRIDKWNRDKIDETNIVCDLSGTIFPGDILFFRYNKDNPLPAISFAKSRFCGDAAFHNTVFNKYTTFYGATFGGGAWFTETTFSGDALFHETTFSGIASFYEDTFSGTAVFARATFRDTVGFVGANFRRKSDFESAIFFGATVFSRVKARNKALHLHSLSAPTLKHLRLTPLDLPLCSFLGCEWPDRLGTETHGEGDIANLKACEELYRAMKQRAAEEHDQLLVSRWHYREKLMAMKRGGDSLFEAVMLRLYFISSGFGERALQALGVLVALLILSYLANSINEPWVWSELPGSAAAQYTMATIPFAKDIPGEGWVKVGRGFWQFLIAVQFTLFALAVRNRFRR